VGGGRKRKSDEKAYIKILNYLIIIDLTSIFTMHFSARSKEILAGNGTDRAVKFHLLLDH